MANQPEIDRLTAKVKDLKDKIAAKPSQASQADLAAAEKELADAKHDAKH